MTRVRLKMKAAVMLALLSAGVGFTAYAAELAEPAIQLQGQQEIGFDNELIITRPTLVVGGKSYKVLYDLAAADGLCKLAGRENSLMYLNTEDSWNPMIVLSSDGQAVQELDPAPSNQQIWRVVCR